MAEYCKQCSERLGLDYDGLASNEICEGCKKHGVGLTLTNKIVLALIIIAILLSFGF